MIVRDPQGWLWQIARRGNATVLLRPGSIRWVSPSEVAQLEPVPGMADLEWRDEKLVVR